ncbi:MAG: DUF444 family protein [Planctomycetaceae bacterium]
MTQHIERDLQRFKHIVKGKVRENLRKYITHGEMLGRKGRETVSIPVPNIDIPHFRHGKKGSGGTGQGEGEIGQSLGPGQPEDGTGDAGSEKGQHIREVEVTLEELASMLGAELELPNIIPKGVDALTSDKDRYNSIRLQLIPQTFQADSSNSAETPDCHRTIQPRKPDCRSHP